MLPLVDAAWLNAALAEKSSGNQANLRLIDVRWYLGKKRGRDEYAAGHLPGAIFVDLDTALASEPASGTNGGPGRHPLPTPERFQNAMRAAGVKDDSVVVAYDDAGGSIAARLWWLLHYFGHEQVAVLDGGIDAWKRIGGTLTTDVPEVEPGDFHAVLSTRNCVLDRDEVTHEVKHGALVLDARARERYRGDSEPVDARPGHIPGAVNAPWSENLSNGIFLPKEILAEKYRALGANDQREIIAYCGSGVTACHDLLALTIAGFSDAKLYEGSWSDWASQANLAAQCGDEAGSL
ncbi:MAG: sulfurtransferase [Polyangiaceae bacterium]